MKSKTQWRGWLPEHLAAFAAWLEAFEAERFDGTSARMRPGKLDRLAAEALADLRQGDVREL